MGKLLILAYLSGMIELMVEMEADTHDLKILDEKVELKPDELKLIVRDKRGFEYHLTFE